MAEPIPNRTCGGCAVCCEVFAIEEPELKKLPDVRCGHCTSDNLCRIYEDRPRTCREFYCGWRLMPLADEWRPDRCGVVIVTEEGSVAVGQRGGLRFHLFGSLDKIFWPPLMTHISRLIAGGTPVILSTPGKPGHGATTVFLNGMPDLLRAVAVNDISAVANCLSLAVQACVTGARERI